MRLSYLYEAKSKKSGSGVRGDKETPEAGGKDDEAEGKIALTVRQRPNLGPAKSCYKEPRSA